MSLVAQGSQSRDEATEQVAEPVKDPLAELYDEAAAELAKEQSSLDVVGESQDKTPEAGPSQVEKGPAKGFACLEEPQEESSENPNQYIIDKLKELRSIYQSKQGDTDTFKVFNLNKVIGDLSRVKHKITTRAQALKLNGSGAKTADKIMEIIQTGGLQRIQAEDTEEYRVCKMFAGIYDVGAKRAHKWYNMGLRTLEDVEARKDEIGLTRNQAIGLRYYNDLQERIPRAEASAIFDKIREAAMKIDGNITLYIMGSYRRGEQTVGDIDLLLTRDPTDGITHAGMLHKLLDTLHDQGLLTDDLVIPPHNKALEQKYMGIGRLPPDGKLRRIDILAIPYDQKGAALIYFTGDDLFNRSIRLLAHKKGYSLNQRGLYGGVMRDTKRKKMTEGVIVASKTEKEIFDVLGVPWREPHERRRM
ncbi:Nucleotidyltransferase [Calocera cornea HHB12733]|uniref:DNA polymerase n=1 Tax=Calocera cornea HHB12733 TaxID=1353952 RepID=A0A165G478_9BASI|nr:Nucleotidyltransferase [Calocera cornea HHB12733]